ALRPVRLACLIHAANVHSEPGSNPSKKVEPSRLCRSRSPPDRSSILGVEESDWSHRDDGSDAQRCESNRIARPRRPLAAGWCDRPRRQASQPETPAASTSAHHAGFPQGFIYPFARLAIDRIVKEPTAPTPPAGATPQRGATPANNIHSDALEPTPRSGC